MLSDIAFLRMGILVIIVSMDRVAKSKDRKSRRVIGSNQRRQPVLLQRTHPLIPGICDITKTDFRLYVVDITNLLI